MITHVGCFGASWLDLTTGEFLIAASENPEELLPVLASIGPREVLLSESFSVDALAEDHPSVAKGLDWLIQELPVSRLEDYHFEQSSGAALVQETLGVLNLQGFGISKGPPWRHWDVLRQLSIMLSRPYGLARETSRVFGNILRVRRL